MRNPKIAPELQAIVSVEQKRENIANVVEQQKDRLLQNACGYVRSMTPDNQAAFLARTVTALLDDKLADCFKSPEGKLSIFRIIEESLSTGLELGKHAYAVPQNTNLGTRENPRWVQKARYDVKRQGYHALLCGGDKPIFKDLRWGTVYAEDKCTVDTGTGEVSHKMTVGKTRGEMIGVWVQAVVMMPDDKTRTEVQFYPVDYIHNIRDNHSESWKNGKRGPWKVDPIPMAEKTAIKAFCRPWADVKDALAHVIYEEEGEHMQTATDDKPREEVATAILDDALDATEPGRGTEEPEEEKNGQPPEEENIDDEIEALAKDKEDGSLF